MRDVRLLRTYPDGKIPCSTANDGEQLNILISKSKKNLKVRDCDDQNTKSTVQTKLRFDSSDVSPIKMINHEQDSGKTQPDFSRKNKKKKS